jgi:hypothetical protein
VGWGIFPVPSVGSRAGGDNRKRARSAQRKVGPKARPTAGAPAPGSPVRASFPYCVRYPSVAITLYKDLEISVQIIPFDYFMLI